MNTTTLTTELLNFIEDLRSAGYNIGMSQYVAAQDLILGLAAQGNLPSSLARLRTLLAPILCKSSKQQAEFQHYFAAWIEQFETVTPVVTPTSEVAVELQAIKTGSKLWKLVFGVFAVVFVAAIYFSFPTSGWECLSQRSALYDCMMQSIKTGIPNPEVGNEEIPAEVATTENGTPARPESVPTPARGNQKTPSELAPTPARGSQNILWLTLGSPLLVYLLWYFWWRYRVQRFLARKTTATLPEIKQLFVKGIDDKLFQSVDLSRTAQRLRQHKWIASNQLDIIATVEKTLRAGGLLRPVAGKMRSRPQYLVLIDRTTFNDHQAQWVNSLLDKIVADDVLVTRYYFDADPRRCYPQQNTLPPLSLAELLGQHPEHRLLIFSDGEGFINPITGEVAAWVEQFGPRKILLTLEMQWGSREQVLSAADFLIMPASEKGLIALAEQINLGVWQAYPFMADGVEFPEYLSERPRRWLERYAPRDTVVDSLVVQVRDFIGEKGYFWLGACAVYPELRWPLTLYLGYQLELLSEERLAKLARLPWFRYGYMPNWLRRRLVGDLNLEQERAIRLRLQDLLLTARDEPVSDFGLPVVTQFPSLFRRLLPIWAQPKISPLRDYVFLAFMSDRLTVKVPKLIRKFIEPSNLGRMPSFSTIGLFVVFLVVVGVSYSSLQQVFEHEPVEVSQEVKIEVFQDTLKDGSLGPKMVNIPAGSFQMGDIQGGGDSREQPVHKVSIEPFAMGQYEVTFAEYDKFAQATGRKKPDDRGWGRENRPVINVSWHDAVAYNEWLSEQTGKQYRLPTEAEWEYAARAGTETKYWWGNEIGENKANCNGCGSQWDYEQTAPVGSFSPNPFGLYDTVGNVWEWVADSWHENYTNAPNDGGIWVEGADDSYRVLRGGSWDYFPVLARAAFRLGSNSFDRYDFFGFRVVRVVARI